LSVGRLYHRVELDPTSVDLSRLPGILQQELDHDALLVRHGVCLTRQAGRLYPR
jgi:hypothetical protein